MAITQKHNNRYHWLQSELPFKLPTNGLYYCTDSKNVYIYNINEDPELLFDSSSNPALYPLPVDLPVVWWTSDTDPITLMLSTDAWNIASLGTDWGLMVDETSTSISEDDLGNQSYINEDSVSFNINTYQLPAPVWESKALRQSVQLSDWNYVDWDEYFARVPLVDQRLIDEWILFVEYGRLKNPWQWYRGKYSARPRGSKISFYSPWYSQTQLTGRWYSAWTHNWVSVDRPNMFQVIHQWFDAPLLPRWSFYRIYNANFYNGIHDWVNNPVIQSWVPHMTWWRIKRVAWNVISDWSNWWRSVINWQLRDIPHSSSEWYSRLVVIKNGKVIKQWPVSEPLHLEWKLPIYRNEFERRYSLEQASTPITAKLTIEHKYKK